MFKINNYFFSSKKRKSKYFMKNGKTASHVPKTKLYSSLGFHFPTIFEAVRNSATLLLHLYVHYTQVKDSDKLKHCFLII